MSADRAVLVGDIGGTHARFALAERGATLPAPRTLLTAMEPSLEAALARVLDEAGRPVLAGAALCGAGPVRADGTIAMTNAAWTLDRNAIAAICGTRTVRVLNDFEAAALALPALAPEEAPRIAGGEPEADAPRLVLGPGTGLGAAALIADGRGRHIAVAGEAGHMDLAPGDDRELALLHVLQRAHGHVSVERVVSGPGLETLYMAIAALDGVAVPERPAPVDIAGRARAGSDPVAIETVERFTLFLAAAAGNLALAFGARGGVYLAGGILPRWGDLFDTALFVRRFTAKGRFADWLSGVPVYRVNAGDLGLRGALASLEMAP